MNYKKTAPSPFELLLGPEKIEQRVGELGSAITKDYSGETPLLIGVLKGCMVFLADLIRAINLPMEIEFISGAAYRKQAVDKNSLMATSGAPINVQGRHVLLVEGIVDTGHTAAEIMGVLDTLEPASAEIVTLLDKPGSHRTEVSVKYKGFSIGNDFVIGYGLDNTQLYRNLPYIGRMLDR